MSLPKTGGMSVGIGAGGIVEKNGESSKSQLPSQPSNRPQAAQSHQSPHSNQPAQTTSQGGDDVKGPAAAKADQGTASTAPSQPSVPWAFIDCPTDTLIILISHMLNLLIQHNDQVVLTPDSLTRFHSRAAPGISVLEYLRRIVKYTNMEKIPLLSLLAYIDITCQHLPTFTLSSLTVHRFLIAGVCAGSKAQCDVFCTNAHYAKVGGIKTQELNALEREFLKTTRWDLCCHADLLQRYYTSLIRSHGGYVQSPEPAESPFQAFPLVFDTQEVDEGDQDEDMSDGDGEGDEVEGENGDDVGFPAQGDSTSQPGGEQGPVGQGIDVSGMMVDQEGTQTAISPTRAGLGVPTKRSSRVSFKQTDPRQERSEMDVDPSPGGSGSGNSGFTGLSGTSGEDSTNPGSGGDAGQNDSISALAPGSQPPGSGSSPYSTNTDHTDSSSIRSSTRSSLRSRRTSRGGGSLSVSYSDTKLAEPKLDKATATGEGASWASTADITNTPTSNLAEVSNGHQEGNFFGDSAHVGNHAQPTSQVPAQSNQHHHGAGAHLLKNLVGGIFHRHKHDHSHPGGHDNLPSSRHSSQDGRSNVTAQTTTVPVASTQFPVPSAPGRATGQTQKNVDRVNMAEREIKPPRSPRAMKSPGMAKTVTPRVRTRDELVLGEGASNGIVGESGRG